MADVFISYSESDASPLVEKIADALDRAKISCWYMEKDSREGRYAGKIMKAIQECRVFLLVLNEKSAQSLHVLNEVDAAFEYKRLILPFCIDNCVLPEDISYYLRTFTRINAKPTDEKSVQDLAGHIAKILNRDPPPVIPDPPFVTPPPSPMKIIKRGECGDNVRYDLTASGVLTISGNGPMRDFELDVENKRYNTPWWKERETISCARILHGVTSIGDFAFLGCAGLTSVHIPDSVTEIEWLAFAHCASLTSVDIPDSVTEIGLGAFCGCKKLERVSVPAEAYIMDGAFPRTTEVIRRP